MTTKKAAAEADSGRFLQNAGNFLLMLGVIVPPALALSSLKSSCSAPPSGGPSDASALSLVSAWSPRVFGGGLELGDASCDVYLRHPTLFVNLFYFVFVDVGFYLVYLAQGSTWLIDPHWQLIPVSICAVG